MSHQPYPDFSPSCFGDIIRIGRGGTIREELPLFVKCLYTIEGAALKATVGEPDAFGTPFDSASRDDLVECQAALAAIKEDGPGVFGADGAAIDPATIAIIVQSVMALINLWLNRKN